jgi:bifunctional DNA-binding transcriptional regulator/antitoxin component of YhaV-PrlF toxin-antitoxin module
MFSIPLTPRHFKVILLNKKFYHLPRGYPMQNSIISTKGQVVIPQPFRKKYALKPRSKAMWVDLGYALLLVPRLKDPVAASRGLLKNSHFTQAALKEDRREERQRENRK